MSKPKSRTIFTHKSKSAKLWNGAISDATKEIQEAKSRISRLRQSIKTFEELRDSGEPFPGESAKQSEASQ